MSTRRVQKAAEAIREVVSMAILTEIQDPRVRDVTVTYVEVSGDLRYAKIHVSVMAEEKQQKLTIHGLQHAAGFLQWKIAQQLQLRYTPRLNFELDQGVKRSLEVAQILQRVLPKSDQPEPPAPESIAGAVEGGPQEESGEGTSSEAPSPGAPATAGGEENPAPEST